MHNTNLDVPRILPFFDPFMSDSSVHAIVVDTIAFVTPLARHKSESLNGMDIPPFHVHGGGPSKH
jgi:hypothetical protein